MPATSAGLLNVFLHRRWMWRGYDEQEAQREYVAWDLTMDIKAT
jgi:hypothetical protein